MCKIELVINDWGMAGLIRKKYPNQFLLTLGCLLSKQRRDTRMNYVNRNDNEFSKEKSQIDAPFYRQYLAKHFNITRVSLKTAAIDQSFFTPDSMIGMTLHFPYFQRILLDGVRFWQCFTEAAEEGRKQLMIAVVNV